MTHTEDPTAAVFATIRSWVDEGRLDPSTASAVEASIRIPGDDLYDPDVRLGRWLRDTVAANAEDRSDLATLLDIVFEFTTLPEEAQAVADRIGWKP